MRKTDILLFLAIVFIFTACGNNIEEEGYSKTYDMWRYMTPRHSLDIEYATYENGQNIDYFTETTKVFPSGEVERVSQEERTLLTPYDNSVRVEESRGKVVEVQRYVKIGDTNIFRSSSIGSCSADDYFFEIRIKDINFHEVIKVTCSKENGFSEIYYGYDEGIVAIYRKEGVDISEIVKVRDTELR